MIETAANGRADSESKSSRELPFRDVDVVTGESHAGQVGLVSRLAFEFSDSLQGFVSQCSSFASDGTLSRAFDMWHATVKRGDELVQVTKRSRSIRFVVTWHHHPRPFPENAATEGLTRRAAYGKCNGHSGRPLCRIAQVSRRDAVMLDIGESGSKEEPV